MIFFDTQLFQWIVLPLLIVLFRVADVTIGTIRIILLSKGMKRLAPLFGFFEILIWLIALKQIMNNLTNFVTYIAYALGFALGTFIGMIIEEKLSLGWIILRIITRREGDELANHLRREGHRVTDMDARGNNGNNVKIIFTIIKRQELPAVGRTITEFNPNAFYSVEDVRFVTGGAFISRDYGAPVSIRKGRKGK